MHLDRECHDKKYEKHGDVWEALRKLENAKLFNDEF
jgi:hypothetical protein